MFNINFMMLVFMISSANAIPINNSLLNSGLNRTLSKRALSYIANETVCIIDNLIYQNGDPIPTDDPCESCKCRPPGYACVLRECEVKPGCKEITVEGECCPTYQCGCEHDGKVYKDGEIVPNPNKLLKCYRCRCRGSSIICGLMECQYRFDCQARYEIGECCPNYDHCFTQTSTEQTVVFDNQTVDTSINSASTAISTTLKASSMLTNLFSPAQTEVPSNFVSSIADNKDDQQVTTTQSFSSLSTEISNEVSSTISPFILSTDQKSDIELNRVSLIPVKMINNALDSNQNKNEINQLHKTNDENVKLNIDQTSPSIKESVDDETMVSNINLNKLTTSSIASNEVTPMITNQVDQFEKRVDEAMVDVKVELEEDGKNEIQYDTATALPNLKSITNSLSQALTTSKSLIDSVPSSTTVQTDTTILAPNTSSIINSVTQSPIINSIINESKDELKDESKDESKDELKDEIKDNIKDEIKDNIKDNIKDDLNKKDEDSKVLIKNETLIEPNKDDLISEMKEENIVKKLEDKLEGKSDDDKPDSFDEFRTPINLLEKVLNNCTNGRCNSLDKLIKVTEDVLSDLDSKVIEKIKLSDAFEKLKSKLITSNPTIIGMALPTDSPNINSTESSLIHLEENYPTTVRYVRTIDLNAEHKDSDTDDLELEDDPNKTFRIF